MKVFKLIFKNVFRHKLRAFLTILGIGVAVMAFGLLRSVVTAFGSGVQASSADRLVTRDAVTFINPLPLSYFDQIKQVPGVRQATYLNWFGGTYIDQSHFFARYAVDPNTFFSVYPEYEVDKKAFTEFQNQRNTCIVGSALAERYHFKVGDIITINGDIYPGRWEFLVAGIYKPELKSTDAMSMFLNWNYLNEQVKQIFPGRADEVGWYVEQIDNGTNSGTMSRKIDALFANSPAETKTESERQFQQGFLASAGAIISAMNYVSFVIVGIIMLVLANTMIMSARERTREYAVLKAIGFSGKHLIGMILGESLLISLLGGILGIFLTYPIVNSFASFASFLGAELSVQPVTLITAAAAVVLVGIAASVFPIQRAVNTRIADGIRFVG
jgi:putative ABC transport system permease protein